MNHDHSQHDSESKGFWGSRYSIGLIVMRAKEVRAVLAEQKVRGNGAHDEIGRAHV